MALDRYFSDICTDTSDAVLRFYGWKPYCISIGRHQDSSILNLNKISAGGYDVVQRPTGGRAIFHAEELTYSIITPRALISHRDLYIFMHELLCSALNDLGYHLTLAAGKNILPKITQQAADFLCFTRSAFSEIQFESKKVVGSAQRLYHSSILQHGSILIGTDHEKISEFIIAEPKQISQIRDELKLTTICLQKIKTGKIAPEQIARSIVKQLELKENISVNFKNISNYELKYAGRHQREIRSRNDK